MIQDAKQQPKLQPERVNNDNAQPNSALQSRNVRIRDRRTSVRLEPAMWSALHEIARLEECTIHDLCSTVYDLKETGVSFTGALRVFLMEYYRTAASAGAQAKKVLLEEEGGGL